MGFSTKKITIFTLVTVFIAYKVRKNFSLPPIPKFADEFWGSGDAWEEDKSIRPFFVNVSNQLLSDLKYRLDHTVLTLPLAGIQQQYGMNTHLLREIINYWLMKYNWREREKLFNKYPQFLTSIQGLDIHYIHVKPESSGKKILPLLVLHGWPGSVREFFEMIPLLTTPRDGYDFVFEVIVASLPGYGFSGTAVRPGLGAAEMSVVFKNLMQKLGFQRFYTQGGDFGGIILHYMALIFPNHVLGYHSNMCTVYTPLSYVKTLIGAIYPTLFTREDHVNRVYPLGESINRRILETGYFHIQATKPDTIGVALRDSPAGLAAYILEKFTTGTNSSCQAREDGCLSEYFTYDALLDNVMVYWVTGSMPTAMRLYAETFNKKMLDQGITRHPIQVPTACARFTNDFYASDGILKEIHPNLLHLSDYHGGHFAAFQLPDVLATDVYIAIKKFEEFNSSTKT